MKAALTSASLLLLLSAPPAALADDWRWGEFDREELFSPYFAECPDADAVVLLDHQILRVDEEHFRMKVLRHERLKIMTERGMDRAVVRIPVRADQELKNFRAHTVIPPGNELKVEKSHWREEPVPDGKVLVVTFPGVQKGAVLEWEAELRTDRLDVLDEWHFQGRDPVRVSRYELQFPAGMAYDASFPWAPGMMPVAAKATIIDPDSPRRQLEQAAWELRNLPPVRALPFVPYPEEYALTLHVQIASFKSTYRNFDVRKPWSEVGRELGASLATSTADAAGVQEWAWKDAAVAAAADPAAKARALFARVRDGLGTDAPAPHALPAPPRAVVAAGHGTPIEKNLVLLALLKAGSLPADPVFLRTRAEGRFEEKRTDPRQFDHVVLRLAEGGTAIWLDAADGCPFGTLAPSSRVARGVQVGAEGGTVVDIASGSPQSSREVATQASLDRNGTLEGTARVKLTGDRALDARLALARGGVNAWAESLVRRRFGDAAAVTSATAAGASDPSLPLEVEVKYRVPAYAKADGERMRCQAPFLECVTENPLPEGERPVPVEFPFVGTSHEEATVALPAGWVAGAVPPAGSARTSEVTARLVHKAEQAGFSASRDVKVREARVEDQDLDNLRTFYETLRMADAAVVELHASSLRSAAAP